jgi:hypothetical protein
VGAEGGRRRLTVAAVVLAVAALVIGVGYVVLGRDEQAPDSEFPRSTRSECLDVSGVGTVGELNRFVQRVRGDPAFAGGDVGASVTLQDGRQLFVFGDTLRDPSFRGQQFVRNSMLVVSRTCASVILPADDGAVIPDRADGVGYWPMSVARIERLGYDLVGVAAQRVRSNDDESAGVFAFDILGPAIAVYVVPEAGVPQLLAQRDIGPDRVDVTVPMWGAASAVVGDWVYLYGTARPAQATYGGFSLRVARARPDHAHLVDQWQYWDGARWQTDADAAVELIGSDGGVSQTLSVFRQHGRWYAVSKQDEVLGRDLAIWTAPGPTGPFTLAARPVEIPSDAATGTLRYLPLAHPDLLPKPGTVVVSYSQNNTDFAEVVDDPRIYRPRFVRVRLPRP